MDPDIPRILTFWFAIPGSPSSFSRWFLSSLALDSQISSEFGPLVEAARTPSLDHWDSSPQGALALLILLDQFPRNIYRNDPSAFASDPKAMAVAVRALARGFDRQVEGVRQAFFYTPLMHDEYLLSQVASVACYEGMVARGDEGSPGKEFAMMGAGFARSHKEAVLAFGRFPSRYRILGRASTAEEVEFLKGHPSGF